MSRLKYKCLFLDHDDTVMDSTRDIHYPAFLLGMDAIRPGVFLTLDEFFLMNFRPGIVSYYRDVLRMNDKEYDDEFLIWQAYVDQHIPSVFPGMSRVIKKQKELGGLICVSSHSVSKYIYRDYEMNGLPRPDAVYGWDMEPECRKPSPFAMQAAMKQFELTPRDIVMVDDLRFGCEMAHECGALALGVGWAYDLPEIRNHMQQNSDRFFTTPEELFDFLFED